MCSWVALAGLQAAFDGRSAFGGNDRVVAVREHEAAVRQRNGFGAAGTAFGEHGDHRHGEPGHFIEVFRNLLRRAGRVLDGEGAGREDIGMDRDAFGFRDLHVLEGFGVAPRLDGAAVAEFLAVAFFLADDHDELVVGLLAAAAGDGGAGDEHTRIDAVLFLTADFREVVVHVLKDVTQADTLRVADDAHLVHRLDLRFQLALHEREQFFQRGELRVRIGLDALRGAAEEFVQAVVQQLDVFRVLAVKDIPDIIEAFAQMMCSFFDIHAV